MAFEIDSVPEVDIFISTQKILVQSKIEQTLSFNFGICIDSKLVEECSALENKVLILAQHHLITIVIFR